MNWDIEEYKIPTPYKTNEAKDSKTTLSQVCEHVHVQNDQIQYKAHSNPACYTTHKATQAHCKEFSHHTNPHKDGKAFQLKGSAAVFLFFYLKPQDKQGLTYQIYLVASYRSHCIMFKVKSPSTKILFFFCCVNFCNQRHYLIFHLFWYKTCSHPIHARITIDLDSNTGIHLQTTTRLLDWCYGTILKNTASCRHVMCSSPCYTILRPMKMLPSKHTV